MSTAFTEPAPAVANTVDRAAIIAANPGVKSAARWFWWIAALSVINTVLLHTGSETSFIGGLGFTLMADAFFREFFPPAAFIFDALCVGFFWFVGLMGGRGRRWAFLAGGILYALDTVIFLAFQDWFPFAFHLWALFSIWTGGMQLHREIKARQSAPALPSPAFDAAPSA